MTGSYIEAVWCILVTGGFVVVGGSVVVVVVGGIVVVVEGIVVVTIGTTNGVVLGAAFGACPTVVVGRIGAVGADLNDALDSIMNFCSILIVRTSPANVFIRRRRSYLNRFASGDFMRVCVKFGKLSITEFEWG